MGVGDWIGVMSSCCELLLLLVAVVVVVVCRAFSPHLSSRGRYVR